LCHAREDKSAAKDLYHCLKADGFDPWLDEQNLLAGQNWQKEIPEAIKTSKVLIILLTAFKTTKKVCDLL
jgi:TIR domain